VSGRIQLAINVDDLDESIGFYGKLFGTEPAKVKPGYANFAIADPPLKLIGERWEIYTVLEDSQSFWGQGGAESWAKVEGLLDPSASVSESTGSEQCCGEPSRPVS
jgi:catechol 2,3-dioxygenase-like lactoylglutathione lyase family enzyme